MSQPTTTTRGAAKKKSSFSALAKVFSRLVPKQVQDELNLALLEMKAKGIQVGIASAFFAVVAVFGAFLVVMLLVALVFGVSIWFDWSYWFSALIIGAVFLVILLICALIGWLRLKKALPLKPEMAIRGLRYDVGVIKEGRAFDERSLESHTPSPEQQAENKAKQNEKERRKEEQPAPDKAELRKRTGQRRAHLADLRDDLGRKLDFKGRFERFIGRTQEKAERTADDLSVKLGVASKPVHGTNGQQGSGSQPTPQTGSSNGTQAGKAPGAQTGTATPSAASATQTSGPGKGKPNPAAYPAVSHDASGAAETVKDRWVPLSVFAASAGAFAVFVRKLAKKS